MFTEKKSKVANSNGASNCCRFNLDKMGNKGLFRNARDQAYTALTKEMFVGNVTDTFQNRQDCLNRELQKNKKKHFTY